MQPYATSYKEYFFWWCFESDHTFFRRIFWKHVLSCFYSFLLSSLLLFVFISVVFSLETLAFLLDNFLQCLTCWCQEWKKGESKDFGRIISCSFFSLFIQWHLEETCKSSLMKCHKSYWNYIPFLFSSSNLLPVKKPSHNIRNYLSWQLKDVQNSLEKFQSCHRHSSSIFPFFFLFSLCPPTPCPPILDIFSEKKAPG